MTASSPAPWPALRVTYHVTANNQSDLDARVESLLLEQTVELPRAALRDKFVLENIVGRVESVKTIGADTHAVEIDFPISATGSDPAQFQNVLFGNSSIQEHVKLVDFKLPSTREWPEHEKALPGPQFGTAGLRNILGVRDRALTSTALKPIGLTVDRIETLCALFAHAGIDIIKDDHGLANQNFHPFKDRVRACQKAVRDANKATGRQSIYVPNLIGTPSVVLEQLKFAQEEGCCAVMLAPMLLGLPFMAEIVAEHASVPVIAHTQFRRRHAHRAGAAVRQALPALRRGRDHLREFRRPFFLQQGHLPRLGRRAHQARRADAHLHAPDAGRRHQIPERVRGARVLRRGSHPAHRRRPLRSGR